MIWVAWRMLTGDTAKYLGAVFGVAFGVLLITQQASVFVGIISRTANPLSDVREASIWVCDEYLQNADEIEPMSDNAVYRVRGVEGIEWAVRLYKGMARARKPNGLFRQVILLGIDDQSLVGAPRKILMGDLASLRRPSAVFIDKSGYESLWPGEPLTIGREIEMNDRRAVIVGICETSAPFQSFPVIIACYSQATGFVARERNQLSFVVGAPVPGVSPAEACRRITAQTGLMAMTYREFIWLTIKYYLENTGIPVNFGITIVLGFVVGTAIAGQTFYLFTLENLRHFGALKAMGVNNRRLTGMVLLQSLVIGLIGYSLGIGMAVAFFEGTKQSLPQLRGINIPWQIAVGAGAVMIVIMALASLLSLRKVLILEPAVVFRG
ncbi:MAG: ABC transporter permease [Planctomycetota bacterium]